MSQTYCNPHTKKCLVTIGLTPCELFVLKPVGTCTDVRADPPLVKLMEKPKKEVQGERPHACAW